MKTRFLIKEMICFFSLIENRFFSYEIHSDHTIFKFLPRMQEGPLSVITKSVVCFP